MSVVPTRKLPSQPNLEQLRKQAKDLHALYRQGDPQAAVEVRQYDWQAPKPADFALHDAQRVLARAYGFESWSKLKAYVDGANIRRLVDAVKAGNQADVRSMLHARPELINTDVSGGDERNALHFAVLNHDLGMTRLLMEAGANARKGVYPHRSATTALALASDRGYGDIVGIIEEEERSRREEMSCPNATVSPVQDEISDAIENGDRERATSLLEADRSLIQACDRHGATPLHIAAQHGHLELVDWLLARRASVHKKDIMGLTALDRAAIVARPDNDAASIFPAVLQKLVDKGGAEWTAWSAAAAGNATKLRELIAANPSSLREIGKRGGLLTIAVNHGQLETVNLLLDLGADVDERQFVLDGEDAALSWGEPLWCASRAGHYEISELLLNRGADPNSNLYASGWPIRNAWEHEDTRVKRLLLDRGAKLPAYMIGEFHQVEEARRLLDTDPSEQIVKELLDSAGDSGCPEIVEMALRRLNWPRSDVNWHWYLIQPIRGIGHDGKAHVGHFECFQLLLRHGIDPDVAALGQTALHFGAAWNGGVSESERARFAAMLLDHGASLDKRDELLHSTPLAWACRWGRVEMAKVLLERGAPVHEPEAEPWARPVAWAERYQQQEILKLLRVW